MWALHTSRCFSGVQAEIDDRVISIQELLIEIMLTCIDKNKDLCQTVTSYGNSYIRKIWNMVECQ